MNAFVSFSSLLLFVYRHRYGYERAVYCFSRGNAIDGVDAMGEHNNVMTCI